MIFERLWVGVRLWEVVSDDNFITIAGNNFLLLRENEFHDITKIASGFAKEHFGNSRFDAVDFRIKGGLFSGRISVSCGPDFTSDNVAVRKDLTINGQADQTGFETSRYCYQFIQDGVNGKWRVGVSSQRVIVPDLSTMVLTNIIGFEIPRAQNVNGPWIRMRGGEMNDDKAQFDKTSYQTVQVGWDKTFEANNKGSWNAGIFFEGDWAYGRGNWRSMWGTINGNLKSSSSGAGAGLYVSRGFKNGWYVDTIGRMNVFENEVNMNTCGVNASPENNYRAGWSSSIFSLALEVGKDFESRDGHWSFNPYNRLIYTNAPNKEFDVVFGDNSIVNIHNNAVDAWTNKLGARLAYKTNYRNRNQFNRILFVGTDWYRGLSGDFTTQTKDTLVMGDQFTPIRGAAHPKNDLNYGTATFGVTVLPKDKIALTAQTDMLFGDVEGYAVGLSGRISF